jgi:2'-5' RNA ligase
VEDIESMIRSFIAIDLPEPVRRDLGRLQDDLRTAGARVSWVRPESIHLTLKFLGDIGLDMVPVIGRTLNEIGASQTRFRLQPKVCGAFPSLKQMRVLWVGLVGDLEPLKALQKRLETALSAHGFAMEKRPFKGHLTLGRVKSSHPERALLDAVLEHQSFQSEAFDVTGLVLYKSDLSPKGAHYTVLEQAAFGA